MEIRDDHHNSNYLYKLNYSVCLIQKNPGQTVWKRKCKLNLLEKKLVESYLSGIGPAGRYIARTKEESDSR